MTFANNYHSLSSRYPNNYQPHRPQPPQAPFTRKRPYTPPRAPSPAYPYFSPSRNPPSARPRRREIDSPHSSSQSSYAAPPRRPQKRRRHSARVPLPSPTPKDLYDGKPVPSSTVVQSASFSQGALGCISTAVERKQGLAQDGIAQVWDVRSNPPSLRLRNTLHHPSRVFRAALSPDALTVVTTSQDGDARVWSAAGMDYTVKRMPFSHPFRNARACALSPDSKYVAVSFYSGSKKPPTFEGGECISSFKSQIFVTQLQTCATVFERVEKGIADQIFLADNASVIAIGLCGVTPAPKIARRHRVLLYNRRGKLLISLEDCFPPEQHSCTAWHMSITGERLALCSKSNDLQVYSSGPRKDWKATPTFLSPPSFRCFSQCRFARNHDILAAVGSSGKSGESVLGLFRVSDATVLFVIPMQISMANVLDIHPYVSAPNAMDTHNTSHVVSVISAVSAKASRPGSPLNLQVYSDPRAAMRGQRFSQQESKRARADQRTSGRAPVDNPRKRQSANRGTTPFRLCRDPSPIRPVHYESPSASRSSAAMKSSESSAQTPLHNRFASWSFENNAKQTLASYETKCQNSLRDEKQQSIGEKVSICSDPSEGARKTCDRASNEDVKHTESSILPNADTAPSLEKHKNMQTSDVAVRIAIHESSAKSRSVVNINESMSSIQAGSLSNIKNSEAQPESNSQLRKSISPSSANKLESPATSSKRNVGNAVQEKRSVHTVKDTKASSGSEKQEDRHSNDQKKKTIHIEKPSSTTNIKASEPFSAEKDKHGEVQMNAHQRSGGNQRREEGLVKRPAQQEGLIETHKEKIDTRKSSQRPRIPMQKSNAKRDGAYENKKMKLDISGKEKNSNMGHKSDNDTVIEKNLKPLCPTEEGSEKMKDCHNPSNEACEKDKSESPSAISTPQSDDWTPATRFAAREQKRMREAESNAKTREREDPTPKTPKRTVTDSKHKESVTDAHQKHVNVEKENEKAVLQNDVGNETLPTGRLNHNRTSLKRERSSRDPYTATKNIKTEVQRNVAEGATTAPENESEKQDGNEKENPKIECDSTNLTHAPKSHTQEAPARVALKAGELRKGELHTAKETPGGNNSLSLPNGIPPKTTPEEDKQFGTISAGFRDKRAQAWTTVHTRLGPNQNEMEVVEDNFNDHDKHIRIPARYLEQCRKVFSEACQAIQLPDMSTLTNQDAYTTMLGFAEKELGYAEKKNVAKIIYDIVGIQNACSLQMFIDAFRLILTRVKAARRERWTEVFSRATCKAGESILVFHARDLLKTEHVRGNIHLAQKWTDTELEALFERISEGMLVDLTSFLHCVDEIVDG